MKQKFQCIVCQEVYDEEYKAGSIQTSPNREKCICLICAKLILEGLKKVKK